MDTFKMDLVFLVSLLGLVSLASLWSKEASSFELIHEINGDKYIVDFNLTEEDCINRLAPHIRNYCLKEL